MIFFKSLHSFIYLINCFLSFVLDVNPLARKFQMPTDMISEEWPNDGTFTDPTLPLHIGEWLYHVMLQLSPTHCIVD